MAKRLVDSGEVVTLSNDNTPSQDGPNQNNPENSDMGELTFPTGPRAAHNRILYTTYLENCRHGFEGPHDLVTTTAEMSFEDRMVFDKMREFFCDAMSQKLRHFEMAEIVPDLTVRMLHPVLARGEAHNEYHLYVDVVNKEGRAVLPDYEAVDTFQDGPASLQLYAYEEDGRVRLRDVLRLISTPAFTEATRKLMAASWDDILEKPRNFIAFGWIMHEIIENRQAAARRRGESEESVLKKCRINLADVKGFHWTGERRPPTFEFSLGNFHYRVALKLDRATKQPNVYIEEQRL